MCWLLHSKHSPVVHIFLANGVEETKMYEYEEGDRHKRKDFNESSILFRQSYRIAVMIAKASSGRVVIAHNRGDRRHQMIIRNLGHSTCMLRQDALQQLLNTNTDAVHLPRLGYLYIELQ